MAESSNPTLNLVGLPLGAPGAHADMRMPASGPVLGRRGVVASASHLASLAGLDVMRHGIQQARRAGLTKADVANTRTWKQVRKMIGR